MNPTMNPTVLSTVTSGEKEQEKENEKEELNSNITNSIGYCKVNDTNQISGIAKIASTSDYELHFTGNSIKRGNAYKKSISFHDIVLALDEKDIVIATRIKLNGENVSPHFIAEVNILDFYL